MTCAMKLVVCSIILTAALVSASWPEGYTDGQCKLVDVGIKSIPILGDRAFCICYSGGILVTTRCKGHGAGMYDSCTVMKDARTGKISHQMCLTKEKMDMGCVLVMDRTTGEMRCKTEIEENEEPNLAAP